MKLKVEYRKVDNNWKSLELATTMDAHEFKIAKK
jgi:hypothetical protein